MAESDASVLSLQPKDAEVDRVTFSEPWLNAIAQQGLSAIMVPYLRKWGITLHDQSKNQKMACRASGVKDFTLSHATIDLTDASNCVLTVLVKDLFPRDWFELLDAARTHLLHVDGQDIDSPMFVSMGNATTFPIECLVFGALTRACIRVTNGFVASRDYAIYGDDIVVPVTASLLLTEVLSFCGFLVNRSKSYYHGWFRESCGADWLGGLDVRPVYLKDNLSYPTARMSLFNRIQRKTPDSPVLPVLLGSVKEPLVGPAMGPGGGETGHFVAPVPLLLKRGFARWNNHVQAYQYTFPSLTATSPKRKRSDLQGRLLADLAGAFGERHTVRGPPRYRVVVRCTTTPWVEAPCAPLWYEYL
jgi:hypothetical protein